MTTYYTKEQAERVCDCWGLIQPLPKKGKQLVVAFAKPASLNLCVITVHSAKSTYGKTLYKLEFTNA
jgi:hypothetical protein